MHCRHPVPTILMLAIAAGSASEDAMSAEASDDPRITTQGFSVDTALVGKARRFDSARIRVEAPSHIAMLVISTDDQEFDLANTQDRSMFELFGLDRRPLHAYDVTLDVAPFINEHFTAPATYRLAVSVTDRAGATATAALTATVVTDTGSTAAVADSAAASRHLAESAMTLTRQAAGDVAPTDKSPLTWTTREAVHVTIRLRPGETDGEIRHLSPEIWNQPLTAYSLERKIAASHPVPYVDVPAARNGAAGTVVAVSSDDGNALIRITGSATHLSRLGTTVTLAVLIRD